MPKIFKIILLLFLVINLVYSENCSSEYKCTKSINKKTRMPELKCTIKNIPIIAEDVFDENGSLKTYFGTDETVCDVLGWINKAVDNLDKVDGLAPGYNQPINLFIKHRDSNFVGGSYGHGRLTLDSDPLLAVDNELFNDEPGYTDGNAFANIMRYQLVHEFFHYAQERTQIPYIDSPWVLEGTARMFEDIVYDKENPYADSAYKPMYRSNGNFIVYILENITDFGNRYRTFAFWKLMQEKCTLDMQKMLQDPLNNFNLVANSCSDIPEIYGDKLAGAFVLYNWSMILKNNMNFFENDEVYNFWVYPKLNKINKPNFQGILDMSSIVGSSIPKYGAKSFLITHETLESDINMDLTFKSNGDLKLIAVRVKVDGSSDISDNFVIKSNDTIYKLTEEDRKGELFVTIVNTTNKEINIEKLILEKQRKTMATLAFHYVYNCAGEVAGLKFKVYTTKNGESKLIHTEEYTGFYSENRIPDNNWIIKDEHLFKDANLYAALANDTIGVWQAKVLYEANNKNEVEALLNNSWSPEIYRYIEVNRGGGGGAAGIGQGGFGIGWGWGNNGDNCSLPVLSYKVQTARMPAISVTQVIIDEILKEF